MNMVNTPDKDKDKDMKTFNTPDKDMPKKQKIMVANMSAADTAKKKEPKQQRVKIHSKNIQEMINMFLTPGKFDEEKKESLLKDLVYCLAGMEGQHIVHVVDIKGNHNQQMTSTKQMKGTIVEGPMWGSMQGIQETQSNQKGQKG